MKIKATLIIGLILSFYAQVSGQAASQLLQKSTTVLGKWETVDNFEYATKRINMDQWQGYDFARPLPENDLFHLFFDLKNNLFLHHTQNHYPGGYLFDTYRLGRDSKYYVYDGIGSRTGKDLLDLGSKSFDSRKAALLNNLPYFILKQLSQETRNTAVLAEGNDFIIFKKAETGHEEYQLDKTTFLLKKITKIQGKDTFVQRFEDYTLSNGLMIAGKSSLERNGKLVYADSLTLFKYNQGIADPVFNFPPGYHLTSEKTPKLSAKTLSKDVYLIENVDADRNIMFINMGGYIVLTEAPIAPAVTRSILEVIHTTLPGIPVKYVHLSHFHNDHIAGIAEVVKEGAAIICTEDMKQPVTKMLQDTDPIYNTKKIEFLAFKQKKVLENSRKKLEFYEIPNSHAKGMSFLYLPEEKLVYQGDLLSLPADSYLTPAIPVTKEFSKFLHQKRIPFTQIIGHHGLSLISQEIFEKVNTMKNTGPLFKNAFEQ
ncbi:Glyoxylase, beta-lactamase superfamily II [Chryseobacterium contaminans]|uniref:Glyoxylase, beta-lactamase superfamily II n=3 Tax=Chryseobacterium contaminans TaxID=1423959 RepID=A0A1M6XY07_9FLAO|nr:MBL fold metallo-hydrolase [Chryseobacterium contaminans]SHL10733.1 Glyoxylase, beta-lactamase superfamily II [Chryseobacterium contaminans]